VAVLLQEDDVVVIRVGNTIHSVSGCQGQTGSLRRRRRKVDKVFFPFFPQFRPEHWCRRGAVMLTMICR
jgi:hypothetical protein